VTLGLAERQQSLLDPVVAFCDEQVDDDSVFALLHRERDRLFPDELFADLYEGRGRHSVPPSILATLLVLQRLFGISDREAVDRFTFDARFRYAAGVGDWTSGPASIVHTVLVRFRMRLKESDDPKRIFRVTTEVAGDAGLLGVRRVLDSAPLFDAVATQDTVTLIRSAIRRLLKVADPDLEGELRAVLARDDDYARPGKPACDWDDADAREALVDALVRDGLAALGVLDGRGVTGEVDEAGQLLATVVGQDVTQDDDGVFGIVRGTSQDRVISTVDPDARHGHKSTAGKFDGYKGHVAIDPDSEIVTGTAVGPANGGDAALTVALTADLDDHTDHPGQAGQGHDRDGVGKDAGDAADDDRRGDGQAPGDNRADDHSDGHADEDGRPAGAAVYGDAAYGSGDNLADLHARGIDARVKVQPPSNRGGKFTKDDFDVDLQAGTVVCPAGVVADLRCGDDGSGIARFGPACNSCPLRGRCTTAKTGRTISVSKHERVLADARGRQRDPTWQDDYRATRPKVERKLAHGLRAGRRMPRRGIDNAALDWSWRFAGVNLVRMAAEGLRYGAGSWQTAPTTA
jgi:hypothetical protein